MKEREERVVRGNNCDTFWVSVESDGYAFVFLNLPFNSRDFGTINLIVN